MTEIKNDEGLDFKARLYERYSSQHVSVDESSVMSMIKLRAPYFKRMMNASIPGNRSLRIFDLGCGYGGLLFLLKKAGYTCLSGVDVSPEQVALAHKLGLENVVCKDIRLFLDETPDASFDVVIAFDILEHFDRPQLFALVDKLHRVLASGGRLILHVPNAEGLFFGTILYGDVTHEQAFTRSGLHQLAMATGFRVVSVKEDTPVVHGIKSLVRRLIWSFSTFFFRLLAVAETGSGFRDKPLSQNFAAVLERI